MQGLVHFALPLGPMLRALFTDEQTEAPQVHVHTTSSDLNPNSAWQQSPWPWPCFPEASLGAEVLEARSEAGNEHAGPSVARLIIGDNFRLGPTQAQASESRSPQVPGAAWRGRLLELGRISIKPHFFFIEPTLCHS